MNRLIARDHRDQLKEGLRRINSIYPDLPLVPLNGNKQPIGARWQNRPFLPSQLIEALDDGGVEVSSSGRSKKIQPQGFGLLTGRPITIEGQRYFLMALDQDGASAESKILELSAREPLPTTVAFTSDRPGRCQYLFLVPEEYKNAIKTKKIKTGAIGDDGKEELLEFRWSNLQSVLPPSVHPTTGEYRWVEGCAIDETPIAPAPDWVRSQMSVSESRRIEQPLKRYPQASISPVSGSSRSQSQLPRHPEQIQIPLPEAVPLEICCRTQVRDWIASGVQKGSGRNDTAIAVGLELVAVERYLQSLGQPVEIGARQLFGEYCQRSGMTDKEEEERWRWCESKNPTPSCSSEGISACLRGWYWREHVKHDQNSYSYGKSEKGTTSDDRRKAENSSPIAIAPEQGVEPSTELISVVSVSEGSESSSERNIKPNAPLPLPNQVLDSTSEQSLLPNAKSQSIEPETMLPEKDKMDARHIGENMQQIPQQTTLIAARLVKTIFEQIRKNPTLQKDLAVDITKPTSVSINVDGKIAYKGLEGKQPLINSVEPEDLQVVAKALTLNEGETLDESRDISISVNGKEVFKVERGKLLFNQFSPQLSQNLSESLEPKGQSVTTQPETPIEVNESQSVPQTTSNSLREEYVGILRCALKDSSLTYEQLDDKISQNPELVKQYDRVVLAQILGNYCVGQSIVQTEHALDSMLQGFYGQSLSGSNDEKREKILAYMHEVHAPLGAKDQLVDRAKVKLEQAQKLKKSPDLSAPEQLSDSNATSMATTGSDSPNYQVITDSPVTPVTLISGQQKPIEQASIPTVQFSPQDKQQLTSLGLDPSSLEAAALQKLAANQMTDGKQVQYVPVVIIANSVEKEASLPNRSRFSQLLDNIKAAPQKISQAIKSGLGKIKEALAQTGSQISASFVSLGSNERDKASRRQDLNNIAALSTAKDAIFSLGVTTNDGRKVFAGQHYAFEQKGNNITITSANRGTILAYDAQSGFLNGNLSVEDVKVFSEFSSLLDKEKSASRERSVANSTQKSQMEIG